MKFILCLIFFSSLTSFNDNAYVEFAAEDPSNPEWKLKKETDNIKVYYRKSVNSRVNEVKINTTVESTLSGLISVLRDVPNYSNWIYKCKTAHPLGKNTPSEGRYYTELDFPWPLQNRDMISHSQISQDKDTKVVTIQVKGQPTYLEEKKDKVRIEVLELTWILTPLPGGKIHIDYKLLSDPGGNLPAWIINMAIDQGPTQTMIGLRKQVQKKKYQAMRLNYVEEL